MCASPIIKPTSRHWCVAVDVPRGANCDGLRCTARSLGGDVNCDHVVITDAAVDYAGVGGELRAGDDDVVQ